MSCTLAVAVLLALTDPGVAAPQAPAAEAVAPPSVAHEPLFADIVARSQALKAVVDAWTESGAAQDSGFAAGAAFQDLKTRATELAALDMQGHVVLRDRGLDGDLKCILRGISEDMPRKLEAVERAVDAPARAEALSELAYLLDDNAAVILAPPAPEV